MVERMKKLILTNKLCKVFLMIILIIILFFYFKHFFTVGIEFDETFLKKEGKGSVNQYLGESSYGEIQITVSGIKNNDKSAEVIYNLPNNINAKYTVDFINRQNWDWSNIDIKDKDGKLLFEGEYKKNSPFLLDNNGQLFTESDNEIIFITTGGNPYNARYKIYLVNVARLASFSEEEIRGRYDFLIMAVILFVIAGVDMKFPLFFFTLRHFMDVRDPEPSDFYLFMQKVSWFIYPAVGLYFLVIAIV